MKTFGWCLVGVASLVGAYSLLFFDTTVSTGIGRVHNAGQLHFQQNLLIFSAVVAVVGALMALLAPKPPLTPEMAVADDFKLAMSKVDLEKMERMLNSGSIDPNGGPVSSKKLWLTLAITMGKLAPCELLVKRGADPSKADGFGLSPMQGLINLTPEKGSIQSSILELFRNPPPVEKVAKPLIQKETTKRATSENSIAAQLMELSQLKDAGHLNAEEFERAKTLVLAKVI